MKGSKSTILLIIGMIFAPVVIMAALFLPTLLTTHNTCLAAGLGGAGGLESCKADEEYVYERIAVVVGNTANSPTPQLSKEAEKIIKNSLLADEDNVKITLYSATPSHPIINYRKNSFTTEDKSCDEIIEELNAYIDPINTAIASEPGENGAEYLNTILKAARENSRANTKSVILVIGSGLADTAPLNFATDRLLEKDTNEVLNAYIEAQPSNTGLPSYKMDLIWSGCGQVASPQTELGNYISVVQSHYEAILDNLSIKVRFDDDAINQPGLESKKTVKVTPVPRTIIKYPENEQFSDETLGFNVNTAEFRDGKDKAWQILESSEVVRFAKNNIDTRLVIRGYVAVTCGQSVDKPLAQRRADAVKALLREHGLTNEISAEGVGQTDESRTNNLCIGDKYASDAQEIKAQRIVVLSVEGQK